MTGPASGPPRRIARGAAPRRQPATGSTTGIATTVTQGDLSAPGGTPRPVAAGAAPATTVPTGGSAIGTTTTTASPKGTTTATTKRAARGEPKGTTAAVAGVDSGAATASGSDSRKRGWFWHWNSIVTQFAPLIGLKGVGLLNSYTVWTDRREDSPNRGYAFPSQQSEADFYGEERAELITINKILVALDLIEIRKEMIVKPDAQGRRWRVPHNFYRVKDHDDGYVLSAPAVLGVVHLADRDRNVYRYLRRIFSTRFSPIDRDSVWVAIMPVVRRDPTWQRLAAKVETEERRASDRTRAGHASRQGATGTAITGAAATSDASLFVVPDAGDSVAGSDTGIDTTVSERIPIASRSSTLVVAGNSGSFEVDGVDVALTNDGSGVDGAPGNSGRRRNRPSSVDAGNGGRPTIVAATNTTYDQAFSTTMTTTNAGISEEQESVTTVPIGDRSGGETPPASSGPAPAQVTGQTGRLARRIQARRGGSPAMAATDAATIPTSRPDLVDEAMKSAAAARPAAAGAGPDAGAAAIRAFEDANDKPTTAAQRTLLSRLAAEFDGAARESGATGWIWVGAAVYEAVESGSAYVAPRRVREILTRWAREGRPSGDDGPGRGGRSAARTGAGGTRSGRAGQTVPAGRDAGAARETFRHPAPATARRPASAWTRTAAPAAGGEVVVAIDASADAPPVAVVSRRAAPADAAFTVAECGVSSGQVWAAMLTELALDGEIPRTDFDSCVRSAELVGRGAGGALVIGTLSATAQRRASRYLPALRRAAAAIVGVALPVEVVTRAVWLAQHPDRGVPAAGATMEASGRG